jgi:hypothetical protein
MGKNTKHQKDLYCFDVTLWYESQRQMQRDFGYNHHQNVENGNKINMWERGLDSTSSA